MAFFKRIPKSELGTIWIHRGWFMDIVPVYIKNAGSDNPHLSTRNWVPEWIFDLVEAFHKTACIVAGRYVPYTIRITGRLDGGPVYDKRGNLL